MSFLELRENSAKEIVHFLQNLPEEMMLYRNQKTDLTKLTKSKAEFS